MGSGSVAELSVRLWRRRTEIARVALARAQQAVAMPEGESATYAAGMRAAALAAVDYGMVAVERLQDELPPTPLPLLGQARLAAEYGVSLDTVVRRYIGGYTAVTEILLEEAEASGLAPSTTQELLARQAQAFDRLVTTVTEEHSQHLRGRGGGRKTRRLRMVERLLAGNRVESVALGYDLERSHLGVISSGPDPAAALQILGKALDRQLLLVGIDEHETWAWLSGRKEICQEELRRAIARVWPSDRPLALGEQGFGFTGWRMTHRQAVRSWHWASRSPNSLVWYRDIAVSSATLRDEELVAYLRQSYLKPLANQDTRGPSLLETLRAYFEAEGNVSSAAARLRMSRQAIRNRLQRAEGCLGVPIEECRVEIECALRLEEHQDHHL